MRPMKQKDNGFKKIIVNGMELTSLRGGFIAYIPKRNQREGYAPLEGNGAQEASSGKSRASLDCLVMDYKCTGQNASRQNDSNGCRIRRPQY